MNNKGFGMTEMIAFCSVLLFGLMVSAILINKNFKDVDKSKITDSINIAANMDYKKDNKKEKNIYSNLEAKIKKSATNYKNDKNISNEIVTYTTLQEEGYLDKLVNPSDINDICYGYAKIENNKVIPYLRCEGNYATEDYNINFE